MYQLSKSSAAHQRTNAFPVVTALTGFPMASKVASIDKAWNKFTVKQRFTALVEEVFDTYVFFLKLAFIKSDALKLRIA